MTDDAKPSKDELRQRLTPDEYRVTQECGTEAPFTGKYDSFYEPGMYKCVVCGEPLFVSETKYKSGSGWPSFYQPAADGAVAEHRDVTHGMTRIEVTCGKCQAHLGHVFPDGPKPTGLRYCINSASLKFEKK